MILGEITVATLVAITAYLFRTIVKGKQNMNETLGQNESFR